MPENAHRKAVEPTAIAAVIDDPACPKCGAVMESIESAVEGLPLEHLQLCPGCFLVVWRNPDGFQIRQGVPMNKAGKHGHRIA